LKDPHGLQNQLRTIRTRLGISQQDLAIAAGVARQTIGGIEAELYSPSTAVALRLAKALGCRVEEIFWLADSEIRIEATATGLAGLDGDIRVALAPVGGRWIAHPLVGEHAFQMQMAPADGIATRVKGSGTLSVRLLDDPDTLARTVSIAGCTPVLSLWARSAERWHPGLRVHWMHANSMKALGCLARGEVHAAGIHLYDTESQAFNVPFVRKAIPDRAVSLVNLGTWEEGLLVQHGNPRSMRTCGDLSAPGVRLVNRETGAGSRLLLDSALDENGIPGSAIVGYDRIAHSHQEVAGAVASGEADAGVSTAAVAAIYGLDFIAIRKVRYDLAILEEYMHLEPIRQLLSTLDHRWVRSQLEVLGGYDTQETGVVATIVP
jgi:molybdate-binding protein/DNA-binding XRE family transcriptional regulator